MPEKVLNQIQPTQKSLQGAIEASWSRKTSFNPKNWSEDNPAIGQCTVSALVVQDYLGGLLVRVDAILPDNRRIVHYYNELPDGSMLDLTRKQFPAGTIFDVPLYRAREKPLSHPSVAYKYDLLSSKVAIELARRKS